LQPTVELIGGTVVRVLAVKRPASGVSKDVLTDARENRLIADDMFVIAALPESCTGGITVLIDSASAE